jgi:asparagine synthase (glutamine-hydrolysing)
MSKEMTLGTGLAAADAGGTLPHGTWIARLNRGEPRVSATNATERGQLLEASLGPAHALFAGTLYSRSEWADALDAPDGLSDAELLARAYVRWGNGLLDRVRGIFALAVWDREAETLLAARDSLGLYPLFYSDGPDKLVFSNSIDALTREPDVSSAVNLPAIVDHLRHRWSRTDETFFEKVSRVPAGHALESRRGRLHVWRYWDPLPPGMEIDWVHEDELGHFDELLEQAVQRCRDGRPTGIFLSGGLDSVSIAAVAASAARSESDAAPLALSLAFPDTEANEERVQRGVAKTLGIPQIMLEWDPAVGPDGVIARAAELTSSLPAPLLNFWMPAYDSLAMAGRERGCEVILTGAGGDEWLGVTPFYAADLLRWGSIRGLRRLYAEQHRSYPVTRLAYARNVVWRYGARPVLGSAVKHGLDRTAPSLIERERLRRIARSTPRWIAPDPALQAEILRREREVLEREATRRRHQPRLDRRFPRFYIEQGRAAFDHVLVAMEMEETFEQGRRLQMRFRAPYWDSELLAYLCRTPPELLNRGGWSKGLVRESVARRFPSFGFERQRKVNATSFARSEVRRAGAHARSRLLRATALEEAGVVDGAHMRAHLELLLDEPQVRRFNVIWDLLSLECWLQAHR